MYRLQKKFDLNELGAMVIKTTTPKATTGNPQPQIAVLDDGILNSVGLTNPGVDKVISEKLIALRKKIILNYRLWLVLVVIMRMVMLK